MLALTEDATVAVKRVVREAKLGDEAGLRITTEEGRTDSGKPRTDLRLSVVPAPQEGDELLEGTPIFVDPAASDYLADKLLDANVIGGQISFALDRQA